MQRNKQMHVSRYKDFCKFALIRQYPVTEFKLCKYATFLAKTVNAIQSIKAYCTSVCEESELLGYRLTRRGLKFYRCISGIRRKKHHQVKRAEPMMMELLMRIEKVVDMSDDKQLAVWSAMLSGFFLVLRKGNLVPLKRVHDTLHNICRSDVKYSEGVMVFFIRWFKTNQYGEKTHMAPIVGDNDNPICPVRWLLWMMNRIPAQPYHNLFSYNHKGRIVPITYRDLMVNMHAWLDKVGENSKKYSSHSLCRGATTHAFNVNMSEVSIQ